MKTISFSYRLGHSTVHEIVSDVCKIIVKKLMSEVMPVPTSAKWKEISNEFWNCWNFPNCIGSLDGKHVVIQAPPNSGTQYFNYKKTFSIVLLALVDAHYNFIAVDVGAYGKNSDGGIFMHSKLGNRLDQKKLNVPPSTALPGTTNVVPYVILGDEAFPLKEFLMRPYPGKQLHDNSRKIYNYRHCRGRRVVENTFGILTQKFRIYNRRIQTKPENADNIILATCVLHNFIKIYDGKQVYNRIDQSRSINHNTDTITLQNVPLHGGNASQLAFQVRETFKDFFSSEAGLVSWQNNFI